MKVFEIVLMYIVFTITTVDGLLEGHPIPSTEDFINMLNQMNNTFQQSIQKLEESNKKLELSNQQLQAEYTAMTKNSSEEIRTLEAKLSKMESELVTVKSKTQNSPIAFFATLTTTTSPLGTHQTIPYDRVVINLQHGYDVRHSHFIAPVKGIYEFSVSLMLPAPSYGNVELVKNGDVLLPVHSGSKSDHETGSASVVVSLNAGDMVWVRFLSGDAKILFGYNYNQFSGFLIQNIM